MPSPEFIPVPRALSSKNIQGYTDSEDAIKKAFHAGAKKFLKGIAEQLGLDKSAYRLDTNMAGPAVSGETTLHTDSLYMQISESFSGSQMLYRECKSRKDYSGGMNHFIDIAKLSDEDEQCRLVTRLRRMMGPVAAMSAPGVVAVVQVVSLDAPVARPRMR